MFTAAPGVDVDEVIESVRWLASVDLPSCDASALRLVDRRLQLVNGFVNAGLGLVAQRSAELFQQGRCRTPEEVLSQGGRRSKHEARKVVERGKVLGEQPAMSAALGSGEVSSAHADAVAAVAGRLTPEQRQQFSARDTDIAARARVMSPESFRSWLTMVATDITGDDGSGLAASQRRRSRSWWRVDEATGMYIVHAELDPELGRRVVSSLERGVDRLWRAQSGQPEAALAPELAELGVVPELKTDRAHLAAFVFTELITDRSPDRAGPLPDAALSVIIDLPTLVHGQHEHSVCEWRDGVPVALGTARRLACSARIMPVVLDGESVVLDLGREQRLANRAQRRALRAMYRTCQGGSCLVPFDRCQIHHILPFDDGGFTDLNNLLPLCSTHHHLVHEGGWHLLIEHGTRTVTLVRPDGEIDSITRPGLSLTTSGARQVAALPGSSASASSRMGPLAHAGPPPGSGPPEPLELPLGA
jgi:hypothetical protein